MKFSKADMNSIADEARTIHRQLQALGFRPRSPNPNWYRCVVIAMLLRPGTQRAINETALWVGRVLDLPPEKCDTKSINPRFHHGHARTRKYFEERGHRVGEHTFDEIEPFCSTHDRPWTDSDSCTPECEYGLRLLA